MDERIEVLDKGYVELVDVMGSDLSAVNAARASFSKRSESMTDKDAGLIKFLARNQHTSPFRHASLTFEVKAPLMVARQWWKYVVGSDHTMDGWNESSRRYVTLEPEFYNPKVWRSSPENKKQGSGEPVPTDVALNMRYMMLESIEDGINKYNWALANDVAPEQARLLLPAYAMYTNWWWTCSLQSVLHFLAQRLKEDAQVEIQEYAKAIHELTLPHFPVSIAAFVES